jgi:Deoxyribodipyrimidine photolyase
MRTLLILSHDLSTRLNVSLSEAALHDETVIPVYIMDTKIEEQGGASLLWARKCLEKMAEDLSIEAIPLYFTNGDFIRVIDNLCKDNGCDCIRMQNIMTFKHQVMLKTVRDFCSQTQRKFVVSESNQLLSSEQLESIDVNFQHFSSFLEKMQAKTFNHNNATDIPEIEQVSEIPEVYRYQKWETDLFKHWEICETTSEKLFVDRITGPKENYEKIKERGLSPYIRHGQESVRELWETSMEYNTERAKSFRTELIWREFYTISYLRRPQSNRLPFNETFERFPWSPRWDKLLDWKLGKTGFSIVDAAMTQLWKTGWIQNNLRMIVADFLVKLSLINWSFGSQWFIDTLVDADEASNYSSWQWISGTGGFNWPFFRIFNPIKQGMELDPDMSYRKKWLKNNTLYDSDEINDEKMAMEYKNLRARALTRYNRFNSSLKD